MPETFQHPDMDGLIKRIEQLLEARVVCLIVSHPTGTVSVISPPDYRPIVRELLISTDWATTIP